MKRNMVAGLVVAFGVLAGTLAGTNAMAGTGQNDRHPGWETGSGHHRMGNHRMGNHRMGNHRMGNHRDLPEKQVQYGKRPGRVIQDLRENRGENRGIDQENFRRPGMHGTGRHLDGRDWRSQITPPHLNGRDRGMYRSGPYMNGMGRGMPGRSFGQGLTKEQQDRLEGIREEMWNSMTDLHDRMQEASQSFREALGMGDKEAVLSAWNNLQGIHEEMQKAAEPYQNEMEEIIGKDFGSMFRHMDNSWMSGVMKDLEKAGDVESRQILGQLKYVSGFFMHGARGCRVFIR